MNTLLALMMSASAGMTSTPPVDLSCPEWVETQQTLTRPVDGWEVSTDRSFSTDGKLLVVTMDFAFGPPERMAVLAPSVTRRSHESASMFVNTWSFEASEQIWFACGYQQTTIKLSKQLSPGRRECSIEYRHDRPVRAWCVVPPLS
jgi:hypothetical protein